MGGTLVRTLFTILLISCLFACGTVSSRDKEARLLIFSKTEGYRHKSIEAGAAAITKISISKGYQVDHSEDASLFSKENLSQYAAVIFLSTTGDILNENQQTAFEQYIQAGGGFVGVHAATDTEYDWPWYGQLVGAYFDNHPKIQEARLIIPEPNHPTVAHLPNPFVSIDEWYNFRSISTHITPLLKLDEQSYEGGTNGDYHPISWYQNFDGGRAFYTGLGHADETFLNPLFMKHLEAGIDYAVGL